MNPHADVVPVTLPQSPAPVPRFDEQCAQVDEEAANTYAPVPPRRSLTVSVHYRCRGRGNPLPFELDEDENA